MRSENETPSICEETDVKVICAVEEAAEEYKDCPAACRKDNSKEDEKEDTVVRSGSLEVTADPATNRKVVIGGVSDLDTLNFKSDEKITLEKITLDRYGYSSNEGVTVWLEDQQGNKVTNEKTSTKDAITLTFKKDYKEIAKDDELTIVVDIADGTKAGTIGFKVTDIESSAKDTNLSNYTPYQYDMVEYDGTTVNVEAKGNTKTYHYTEGESYEVARVQVKAGSASVDVNGFSFTNEASAGVNNAAGNAISLLDLSDFVDEVTVKADGKDVKGVSYTAKKRDLRVSFDNVNIESKKNATFTISVTFKNLDELGKDIHLILDDESDISAVESKNQSRVKINTVPAAAKFPVYTFNGGKITLSNTKLAKTIDAAQGSEDVIIAEGTVELGGEAIELDDFTISVPKVVVAGTDPVSSDNDNAVVAADVAKYEDANWTCTKNSWDTTYKCAAKADVQAIDTLTIKVNGDEFDGTLNAAWTAFKFEDVEISKSGKIQILADIEDNDDLQGLTVTMWTTTFAKALFGAATRVGEYSDSGEDVKTTDFVGSISISNVKVQAAKWSLSNDNSKKVEFVRGGSSKKTVFEWTYTAKKWDVYLKQFAIKEITNAQGKDLQTNEDLTFYLSVDGTAVAEIQMNGVSGSEYFSDNVLVKKWESVKVKIEADVYIEEKLVNNQPAPADNYKYELTLKWEDENGVEAGTDSADLAPMSFVSKGSITVSDNGSSEGNTLKLTESNVKLAEFRVKPSNKGSDLDLEDLLLSLKWKTFAAADIDLDGTVLNKNLVIKVDGDEKDFNATVNNKEATITVDDINENVSEEWIVVEVSYKADDLAAWAYELKVVEANNKSQWTTFKRAFAPAIIIFGQSADKDETKFTATIDSNDSRYTVKTIQISTAAGANQKVITFWSAGTTYSDWAELNESASNLSEQAFIETVSYIVVDADNNNAETTITIEKDDYKDYFKVGDTYLKIFKAKD